MMVSEVSYDYDFFAIEGGAVRSRERGWPFSTGAPSPGKRAGFAAAASGARSLLKGRPGATFRIKRAYDLECGCAAGSARTGQVHRQRRVEGGTAAGAASVSGSTWVCRGSRHRRDESADDACRFEWHGGCAVVDALCGSSANAASSVYANTEGACYSVQGAEDCDEKDPAYYGGSSGNNERGCWCGGVGSKP